MPPGVTCGLFPRGTAGAVPGRTSRLGALDRRTADALHGHVRRAPHRTLQPLLRRNLSRHPALRSDRLRASPSRGDCLTTFAASALLALATKNFCRSYCNGFGFDAIFRASLYIGLLPLVATAAAPLLILLPLAVMLFRRTLREVAVAVAGLLLPALTLCYVNWAAGGEFLAQVAEPGSAFIAGTPLSLFLSTPVQNLVLPGAVFLLDLTALLFFLSDIYALGTKPRLIFIFNISALLLTASALLRSRRHTCNRRPRGGAFGRPAALYVRAHPPGDRPSPLPAIARLCRH